MTRAIVLSILVMVALVGCSDERQEFSISIPNTLSREARLLLLESLPKMRRAAPGFDRYAKDLTVVNIDEALLNFSDPGYRRLTVQMTLPRTPNFIPNEYKAFGENCFVDISRDGRWMTISKTSCKSVLLDERVDYTPDPLVLELR